jgi:stage II sporulation protein D
MLEKDIIPNTEPDLLVGIILPEDHCTHITLILPPDGSYRLVSGGRKNSILKNKIMEIGIENGLLSLAGLPPVKDCEIVPVGEHPVSPSGGIMVRPVIAGRGFHWQKTISVFLPGTITISITGDRLMLVNRLALEDYLMCVATSEMGQACPEALIESQTIVARSWMLANVEQKHRSLGFDVCNDDCCQRYQGTANLNQHAISAAYKTRGMVLQHADRICDARYSKSCGGMMETYSTIWGNVDLPYLQNKPDSDRPVPSDHLPLSDNGKARTWIDSIPESFCSSRQVDERTLKQYLGAVDEGGTYFRWSVRYEQLEITTLLNKKIALNAVAVLNMRPLERGGSGRIKFLEISYKDGTGEDQTHVLERDVAIRSALHHGFLYSSCFYVTTGKSKNGIPVDFIISGAGWGHGAGLCQIGALGMALAGHKTSEILSHYYPGSRLVRIYP